MALADITDPASVGDYSGAIPTGKRMVTHLFDCTLPGYRGWRWQVTVARPSRARQATICELDLAPGEDAHRVTALERAAVTTSLANLATFPFVQAAVEDERLTLHGLWNDLGEGTLEAWEPSRGEWVAL